MTLAETISADRPAVLEDEHGVLRVGGTRVTLDTIAYAYDTGASAEEIALAYDAVSLADVHGAISFYLRNRQRVRDYLLEREKQAEELQKQFPPRETWQTIRERLIARKIQQGQG